MVNIEMFPHDVVIHNGYKTTSQKEMTRVIEDLKHTDRCPQYFINRSTKCLVREWQAHNLLYDLHLFRNRTKDVDLDYAQWYDFAYHIVGFIYSLFHKR